MIPRCVLRLACVCVAIIGVMLSRVHLAADEAQKDPHRPAARQFPPLNSEKRVSGELVTSNFYHRTGQFRNKAGELHNFAMPPYGTVRYLNTETDLRDVPLGTRFHFFLLQDKQAQSASLATMKDQFSIDAEGGISYRIDEVKMSDGKILATRQSASKSQPDEKREFVVTDQTRFWKGTKQAALSELVAGDVVLVNLAGENAKGSDRCTDIWAGEEAQKLATETQRKKFTDFLKKRGLPGWIEKTDDRTLVVTLFSSDPVAFKNAWLKDFGVGKDINVCVANDELRTWNPPVDREWAKVTEVQAAPVDCFGCSGVRLVVTVKNMLEGFRRGRVVRLFNPSWQVNDMPFGEGLYSEMQTAEVNVQTAKEFPAQFPFRTDFGNEHLPWYQIKTGEAPPHFSAHLMMGELVKVDKDKESGQFRVEQSGELVDFTLIPQGAIVPFNTNKFDDDGPVRWKEGPARVMVLNAEAGLEHVPLGVRCRFHMYQDEKGAFTKASLITDEYTYLAQNKIVLRVESLLLADGKLRVARQIPKRKDYNGDLVQPPDIGCAELRVSDPTRVWKGEQQVKLSDLAAGDLLLVNLTGELPGKAATCTDIWIGTDTHAKVTEAQRKKQPPSNAKKSK